MVKWQLNCFGLLISFLVIAIAQEPRCTGANECDAQVDRNCRPSGGCERVCEPRSGECTSGSAANRDCYCRRDFVRNATGVCIPSIDCQRECGDRECPNRQPSCRCEWFCDSSNVCIISPSGCHCARGYARDSRNVCVPQNTCR